MKSKRANELARQYLAQQATQPTLEQGAKQRLPQKKKQQERSHAEEGMQPPTPFPHCNYYKSANLEMCIIDYPEKFDTEAFYRLKSNVYAIVAILVQEPAKGNFPLNYYPEGRPHKFVVTVELAMKYDEDNVIKLN